MENFTPISASIGGALIGLSAVMLMAFNGRIAGISGVFSGAAFAEPGDKSWRILFVVGLIAAPALHGVVQGGPPQFEITPNWTLIVLGGLLVGLGARLGSGCTSGHGVCGLSRLSPRSMASVATFMAVGMIAVAAMKSVMGG